jgi:hypothetical protein
MARLVSMLSAAAIVVASASASVAADFNSAVEAVLVKQQEIVELDAGRRGEMIACVKQVLAEVPPAQQRYVAEASGYDQMESRFGEIVLANQAEFKQKITQKCGSIAVSN